MTFQNIYIYIEREREREREREKRMDFLPYHTIPYHTIPYHIIWMPSAVSMPAENIRDSKWISGTKKGEDRLVNTE